MKQLPFKVLCAARRLAHHCGLEPLLKRSRQLTSLYHAAYRRTKPSGFAEIALPGYTLEINAADSSIAYNLLTLGCYEPYESSLFLDAVRHGGDVIDVGAHVGYYALMAATSLRGKATVWAFEPHPANYEMLQRNVERNRFDNVIAAKLAISDHLGWAHLYISQDGNTGGHSLAPKPGQAEFVDVRVARVDDVVLRGTEISVIKVDAEGSEIEVLRGMRRILSENDPVLFTEFFPAAIMRAGHEPKQYLGELESAGFEISVIDDERKKLTRMSADEVLSACPPNHALSLLCMRKSKKEIR